jgi:hypothetical protein
LGDVRGRNGHRGSTRLATKVLDQKSREDRNSGTGVGQNWPRTGKSKPMVRVQELAAVLKRQSRIWPKLATTIYRGFLQTFRGQSSGERSTKWSGPRDAIITCTSNGEFGSWPLAADGVVRFGSKLAKNITERFNKRGYEENLEAKSTKCQNAKGAKMYQVDAGERDPNLATGYGLLTEKLSKLVK